MESSNQCRGIGSVSLCSLAVPYDKYDLRTGPTGRASIPGLLKLFANTGFELIFTLYYCMPRARICKRLRSPGFDSWESISPAYVAWRVGTSNRVVVPARQTGNRFLAPNKVYKFALWLHVLYVQYIPILTRDTY
jgi:hypothetical protein